MIERNLDRNLAQNRPIDAAIDEEALAARLRDTAASRHLSLVAREADEQDPIDHQGADIDSALLEQADFNRCLTSTLVLVGQELRSLQSQVRKVEAQSHSDETQSQSERLALTHTLDEITRRIDRLTADAARRDESLLADLDRRDEALRGRIEAARNEVAHQLDEIRMRLIRAERPPQEMLPPFDYFLFEHRFRGSVSEIKQRHAMYLEAFIGRHNVLDVGCGRGEFVELLAEHGVHVLGIDISQDVIDFCRDRGIRSVEVADMFPYLERLTDSSLDGLFASQVVEHLDPKRIQQLLTLAARKIGAGGIVVIETPNPACPEALGNFYVDPTHVRPVPAQLLWYLLERLGFTVVTAKFSSPVGDGVDPPILDTAANFPRQIALYQDYAILAIHR
jgi:2-polyprenyl-3-methyl-5-hydroxy-6-metoxy-1,4-benzoquinol methylase